MEKMTYVAALNYVLTNCELPTDVSEKLSALCAAQVKRNSGEKKPSAKQVANADLSEALLAELRACGERKTVIEMSKEFECVRGMTPQKIVALLRPLIGNGVAKEPEKRVSYFRAVVTD